MKFPFRTDAHSVLGCCAHQGLSLFCECRGQMAKPPNPAVCGILKISAKPEPVSRWKMLQSMKKTDKNGK